MKTFVVFSIAAVSTISLLRAQEDVSRLIDPADPRGPVPTERNRGSVLSRSEGTTISSRKAAPEIGKGRVATKAELEAAKARRDLQQVVRERSALQDAKVKAKAKGQPTDKIDQKLSALDKRLDAAVERLK